MALGVYADLFKWGRAAQLGSGCWKGAPWYLHWDSSLGQPSPSCRAELGLGALAGELKQQELLFLGFGGVLGCHC